MITNQLIAEKVSLFNVPVTVAKIIEAAIQKGWQNPAIHNLQQSLAKSGKDVLPVQVIEICKPEYSGLMLQQDDGRIVSILMPYRISVYEESDGKTYVAALNMSVMTAGLSAITAEAIQNASHEALGIVESVIGTF
jgi:uncharacterized protein (DUF302 family)